MNERLHVLLDEMPYLTHEELLHVLANIQSLMRRERVVDVYAVVVVEEDDGTTSTLVASRPGVPYELQALVFADAAELCGALSDDNADLTQLN